MRRVEPSDPSSPPPVLASGRFASVLLRPGTLFPLQVRRHPLFLFVATLVSTVVCVYAGEVLFPQAAGLVAVALLAFTLLAEMVAELEENRDAIWTHRVAPSRANLRLAAKIVALFLGMLAGYSAILFLLSEESVRVGFAAQLGTRAYRAIEDIRFGEPWMLLQQNGKVLVAALLFGLFFRAGGALLVLGWNASVWGVVYGHIVHAQPSGRAWYAVRVAIVAGPHVAFESGAYVLAALAGIFVSKALAKHGLDSVAFRSVAASSVGLLFLAVAALALAAICEAMYAPWMGGRVF